MRGAHLGIGAAIAAMSFARGYGDAISIIDDTQPVKSLADARVEPEPKRPFNPRRYDELRRNIGSGVGAEAAIDRLAAKREANADFYSAAPSIDEVNRAIEERRARK